MSGASGPYDPNAEEKECPICEHEGDYVLIDHDSMCEHCGHVNGSKGATKDLTEWEEWWRHRRNYGDYEGWTGEDRIKFVGGFGAVYEWGADWE